MFGAFGSLAAMNQSIKQNRELIKANKKNPFEKISVRGTGNRREDFNRTVLNESDRILIISSVFEENRRERRKQIVILAISVLLTSGLVATFLYLW